MERLNEQFYIDTESGTLIEFELTPREDIGAIANASIGDKVRKIKNWGKENDLPAYRESILMDNNIMGELISTKRSIILGKGLAAFESMVVEGRRELKPIDTPAEIAEWLEEALFEEKYLEPAANELFMHGNIFSEFIQNKGGRVSSVEVKKCKTMRISEKDKNGEIPGYLYNPNWADIKKKKETQFIAPINPNKIPPKFIYHNGDQLFSDGYYYHPSYWGGKEWIELSNAIPKFHKANISNGYSIRFHIQIPKDYFLDRKKYESSASDAEKQKCLDAATESRKNFLDGMNAFLSSASNAGRTIFTAYEFDKTMGKEHPGIKINPISADLKDEALLTLFEKSNQANISSQGIHPTLANIESQGKLSSGSEMRNAFNFYLGVKTVIPRKILLRPLSLVMKINGWDKKYKTLTWGFEDIVLAKLDEDKTGTAPENSQII